MSDPLHPHQLRARFRAHLRANIGVAGAVLLASLLIGMLGYHTIAGMTWVDSFLNASMILGGMGPVAELQGDASKLFAGAYALYCGVVFIATIGIVLAPVATHLLRRFHLENR